MNYFEAKFYEEEYNTGTVIFKSVKEVKKGDVVVYYNEERPDVAEVIKVVDEFKALTQHYEIEEVIGIVDMTDFNKKRESEKEKLLLISKMKDKMEEVKMIENLKKYSDKNEEFREMFKMFCTLKNPTSNSEEREE